MCNIGTCEMCELCNIGTCELYIIGTYELCITELYKPELCPNMS